MGVKNYQTREWLIEHYVRQGLSCKECARLSGYGVTGTAVHHWLRVHGIPVRSVGDHMKGEKNHFLGKHPRAATCKRISEALTGRKMREDVRRHRSEIMRGVGNHRYGKERGHGIGSWVVMLNGDTVYMRSRWEVLYADWLTAQGKQWQYEPQGFVLPNGSIYTPDFLCDGVYYEIKGWLNDEDRAKIEAFRSAYPSLTLEVMDTAALRALGIEPLYGNQKPLHLRVTGPRTHICPTCGQTFIPERKSSQFCSIRCNASRPRKPAAFLTCEVCGKVVKVYPSALKLRTTCSVECGKIAGARKRSGENHWTQRT